MTQANPSVPVRVAVVTGASAGIGKAAAKVLASEGWRVIGQGRNPERSAQALEEIRAHAPGAQVDMIVADLSLMHEVLRLGREIGTLTERVDVLLNNAGGISRGRVVTAEGNEATFAANHLAPFLLTRELLPLLRRAAASAPAGQVRVIGVSSSASDLTRGFDWNDIQLLENHASSFAYCNAKLGNIMFTRALAKRLASDGIVANAMHPGVVSTNFASYGDEEVQRITATLKDVSVTAEEGADTLVWLATSTEGGATSGGYFYQRQPAEMNPAARDDDAVERLWTESEAIIARSLG